MYVVLGRLSALRYMYMYMHVMLYSMHTSSLRPIRGYHIDTSDCQYDCIAGNTSEGLPRSQGMKCFWC